ncbi:Na(+) H(+) antiporter subunit E [hydrothermal vent metagenome]|uniref:Na(+) H(+) antiporter subunit E n=1 Tax=hydrothermal vent metagenome TaxID=652676 RepID=A0A1W1EDZ6_9ZZZZ
MTSALNLQNIFVGIVVSFAIAILYNSMFKDGKIDKFSIKGVINYMYILIKNLILSNIEINKKILGKNKKFNTAIVSVKTDLTSDWKKLLLANSITLTPGTLTMEIKGDMLYIHNIEFKKGSDTKEIIREFEEAIAKI